MHPERAGQPIQTSEQEVLAQLLHEFSCVRALAPTQLLPLLQAVQQRLGSISDASMRALAQALNLSRAEVFGVATFYDDFVLQPLHPPSIDICAAEACQARGAGALLRAANGRTEVRAVYCLGNCACGPSVRVGDRILARVTLADLQTLLAPGTARGDRAAGAHVP